MKPAPRTSFVPAFEAARVFTIARRVRGLPVPHADTNRSISADSAPVLDAEWREWWDQSTARGREAAGPGVTAPGPASPQPPTPTPPRKPTKGGGAWTC